MHRSQCGASRRRSKDFVESHVSRSTVARGHANTGVLSRGYIHHCSAEIDDGLMILSGLPPQNFLDGCAEHHLRRQISIMPSRCNTPRRARLPEDKCPMPFLALSCPESSSMAGNQRATVSRRRSAVRWLASLNLIRVQNPNRRDWMLRARDEGSRLGRATYRSQPNRVTMVEPPRTFYARVRCHVPPHMLGHRSHIDDHAPQLLVGLLPRREGHSCLSERRRRWCST